MLTSSGVVPTIKSMSSSERFSIRDHRKLLKSRGGEMEMRLESGDQEEMRVIIEMGEKEMKVKCEGHCDLDKVRVGDTDQS